MSFSGCNPIASGSSAACSARRLRVAVLQSELRQQHPLSKLFQVIWFVTKYDKLVFLDIISYRNIWYIVWYCFYYTESKILYLKILHITLRTTTELQSTAPDSTYRYPAYSLVNPLQIYWLQIYEKYWSVAKSTSAIGSIPLNFEKC